jgi:hypothetical protein
MSWANIVLVAVLGACVTIATIRSVARRRALVLLLLDLPLAILLLRWAAYRSTWTELLLGIAGAIAGVTIWWLALGRRLGPPRDDNILVLTKDDPPPP